MKLLLYMATLIGFIAYNYWILIEQLTGVQVFHKLTAIYFSLICFYIYSKEKQSFIKMLLFEFSILNVIKEFFGNPSELSLFEALMIVIIPTIWYFKTKNKIW
jgi:hypothetical protein